MVFKLIINLFKRKSDMPLEKGKSKKAFKHNVKTEVKALESKGKSPKKAVKQAVAIAFSEKRGKKKK
jgi:hypothetical protein